MKNYIFKKPKVKLASFNIIYEYSAINEEVGYRGTSHLMEHLICHSLDDLRSEFTKNGITFNAYTSDSHVVFYMEGLDDRVQLFKETFIKRITESFNITEEQFENEKQIVMQEYEDNFARPLGNAVCNIFRKYYDYGEAIGYAEDIEAFTLDKAKELYESVFRYPSKIVDIAQKPSPELIAKVSFSEKGAKPRTLKYSLYDRPQESIESDRYICFNLCRKFVTKKDYPYVSVALRMLSGGLDSPLYKELREKQGLTYAVFCMSGAVSEKQAYLCILNMTSDQDKAKQCLDIYGEILGNIENYMTQERFDDVVSEMLIDLQTNKIKVWDDIHQFYMHMPEKESDLKKMTLDKVIEVSKKYLCKQNLHTNILFNGEELIENKL